MARRFTAMSVSLQNRDTPQSLKSQAPPLSWAFGDLGRHAIPRGNLIDRFSFWIIPLSISAANDDVTEVRSIERRRAASARRVFPGVVTEQVRRAMRG